MPSGPAACLGLRFADSGRSEASTLTLRATAARVLPGFVSYATIEEADVAMNAMNGSWVAGREMKVEKTHA